MNAEMKSPELLSKAQQHLNRAYEYREAMWFKEALLECDAALALEPSLAEVYNLRGIVLEELGRPGKAVDAYRRALELEPAFEEAQENLAELEAELGGLQPCVTIATFSYPAQAHISRARLEAEGIWAFVADEHMVTMNWLYANAIGGVKLQVREADAARAREMLAQVQEPADTVEMYEPGDKLELPMRCPNCLSTDIHYEKYRTPLVFLSWLVLRFPLPFLKRKWKCAACGHEWRADTF